jgi:hypothetical protein
MQDGQDFGYFGPRPPSEKQVAYAQRLAQQLAFELPPEALSDAAVCSEVIDEMLGKTPPSERQVAFARQIATTAKIELPETALQSSKTISQYIEEHRGRLPLGEVGMGMGAESSENRPPTEKQIVFAASLAQKLNVGIAAEALQSRSVLSTFIDQGQELVKQGGGVPSGGVPAAGVAEEVAYSRARASALDDDLQTEATTDEILKSFADDDDNGAPYLG